MPAEWNCLEHFQAGRTRLLHFTDMEMQPWRHRHNPLWSIWRAYYRAAVAAGAVQPELVETGIVNGWLLQELADDLRMAPSRMAQMPDKGALAGTATARQRSQELELAALRAEVNILHEEAEILRHEAHARGLLVAEAHAHGGELLRAAEAVREQQTAALARQIAVLGQEVMSLRRSLAWKIGRAVTSPLKAFKKLAPRRAA
jgi:hypothetical protein